MVVPALAIGLWVMVTIGALFYRIDSTLDADD